MSRLLISTQRLVCSPARASPSTTRLPLLCRESWTLIPSSSWRPRATTCLPVRRSRATSKLPARTSTTLSWSRTLLDEKWSENVKTEYSKSQRKALRYCRQRLLNQKERQSASVMCTMAVTTVVKVHAEGIPKSALGPKVSHAPDRKTKFSDRMNLVVDAVTHNKIVAKDLLKGEKLEDLAYNLSTWARGKVDNFVGSTNKNNDMQEGKRAREATGVAAPVQSKNKKRGMPDKDAASADGGAGAPEAKRARTQEPVQGSVQGGVSETPSSSGPKGGVFETPSSSDPAT